MGYAFLYQETAPAFLNLDAGMTPGDTWIRLEFIDSTGKTKKDFIKLVVENYCIPDDCLNCPIDDELSVMAYIIESPQLDLDISRIANGNCEFVTSFQVIDGSGNFLTNYDAGLSYTPPTFDYNVYDLYSVPAGQEG